MFSGTVVGSQLPSAYVQVLDHHGGSSPLTPCGDTLFATAGYSQYSIGVSRAVADGFGGAFVASIGTRNGSSLNLYLQKVGAAGSIEWGGLGVTACAASGDEAFSTTFSPVVAADGAGGCFVVWQDSRTFATTQTEVYLQHVGADGVIVGAWPPNGLQITNKAGDQFQASLVSDGVGGVFVVWEDRGSPAGSDIRCIRVLGDGSVAPGWPVSGNLVCAAAQDQSDPVVSADGTGGVFVAWADGRGGEIYISRLLADGSLAPGWIVDGTALTAVSGAQTHPVITTDTNGNAIVAWMDLRVPANGQDVFAQAISPSQAVQWAANGVAVCSAPADQSFPRIVSSSIGGAIVVWDDKRNSPVGSDDIYAQWVDSGGVPRWSTGGVPVAAGSGSQRGPVVSSDGDGGAFVGWTSSGGLDPSDVFATRIYSNGGVGGTLAVTSRNAGLGIQLSPNPASRVLSVIVQTDFASDITIAVQDLFGRTIRILHNGTPPPMAGVEWDLRDDAGRRVPPGAYFISVRVGLRQKIGALALVR